MGGQYARTIFVAKAVITVSGLCYGIAAEAQSSVTIYGVYDAGIDYVTNVHGKSQVPLAAGVQAPNLFGFRGKEDLGDGLSATFVLENQFNGGNGQSMGGIFGRQAYVGLSDTKWGTLTLGYQYDFMFPSLTVKRYGPEFPVVSMYNLRQGPFNGLGIPGPNGGSFNFDRMAGSRIGNSIKYQSANMGGLTFGAMYGFGGVAGSIAQDSSESFSIDYGSHSFNLDAAYTYVRYPGINNGNSGIRNFGMGGGVFVGPTYIDVLYTNTKNTFTGAQVDVYEFGAMYSVKPYLRLAAAYQFMDGNAVLKGNRAHQLNAHIDYSLSKQTDIFAEVAYQRANSGAQAQIILLGPSSDQNQLALRVGMRHLF